MSGKILRIFEGLTACGSYACGAFLAAITQRRQPAEQSNFEFLPDHQSLMPGKHLNSILRIFLRIIKIYPY